MLADFQIMSPDLNHSLRMDVKFTIKRYPVAEMHCSNNPRKIPFDILLSSIIIFLIIQITL